MHQMPEYFLMLFEFWLKNHSKALEAVDGTYEWLAPIWELPIWFVRQECEKTFEHPKTFKKIFKYNEKLNKNPPKPTNKNQAFQKNMKNQAAATFFMDFLKSLTFLSDARDSFSDARDSFSHLTKKIAKCGDYESGFLRHFVFARNGHF